MQKTIIPDPAKASGQDMLQYLPQKIFPFHGSVALLPCLTFNVGKGHLPIPAGEDVFLGDDTTIKISGQIFKGRQTVAHMGTVDHPFLGSTDRDRQPCVAHRLQETGTKDTGQGEFVKQVFPLDLFPLSPALIDPAAGHNDVNWKC